MRQRFTSESVPMAAVNLSPLEQQDRALGTVKIQNQENPFPRTSGAWCLCHRVRTDVYIYVYVYIPRDQAPLFSGKGS